MSLDIQERDGVRIISLQQGKVNAFDMNLVNALDQALIEAETTAQAVVLSGTEKVFSGGFDVNVLKQEGEDAFFELVKKGGELIISLYSYPKPLIMAAAGHGIALGAIILMTGDVRVGASKDAKYGLNETAIGLPLPNFGMALARDRLSRHALNASVLQSRIYEGPEAVDAGFLDLTVEKEQVLEVALQHADQLKNMPASRYAKTKLQLRKPALMAMSEADDDLSFTLHSV